MQVVSTDPCFYAVRRSVDEPGQVVPGFEQRRRKRPVAQVTRRPTADQSRKRVIGVFHSAVSREPDHRHRRLLELPPVLGFTGIEPCLQRRRGSRLLLHP
jgi:hypothetical protein